MFYSLLFYALVISAATTAAFMVCGDILLTYVLRFVARAYVGPNFRIAWSWRNGSFEITNFVMDKTALPPIESSVGLPVDLDKVQLQQLLLVLPLWARFFGSEKHQQMHSKFHIAGLQVGLRWNEAEKWIWDREENATRKDKAIKNAAEARLARLETWTSTIAKKLKELADVRASIAQAKKKQASAPSSSSSSSEAKATVSAPASWQLLVDEIIDSFEIIVQKFSLVITDEWSSSSLGVDMKAFEIGRGHGSGNRRKRALQLQDFDIFVRAAPGGSLDTCYVMSPFSMEINVYMPFVFQSVYMQRIEEQRVLELEIVHSPNKEAMMQVRPAQVGFLMSLLRPLSYYYDWYNRATIADEKKSVELTGNDANEYMDLYRQQWRHTHETGFLSRMYQKFKHKAEIEQRCSRLSTLESNVLASRLLYLRSEAIKWDVPSSGTHLPFTNEETRRKGDLRKFIANSLDKYEPDMPDSPPKFHRLQLAFSVPHLSLRLYDGNGKHLIAFVVCDLKLEFQYEIAKIAPEEKGIVAGIEIVRFAMLDERNAPTNVFRQLLDRNPGESPMLSLQIFQLANGHMDVALNLMDFSLLVIFDPLLATMHAYLPAVTEDEETQMRFLAYDTLSGIQSPEQREEAAPLYIGDVAQEYLPLLLGGLSLCCKVVLKGWELCLLGDSKTLKSHVLAFTADTSVQIVSSARREAIELELVDVALQPCNVILTGDSIELDITGLRTILELEGEGVDLSLGYQLAIIEPKSMSSSSTDSIAHTTKAATDLWGIARTAASAKQIAELDRSKLQKSDEASIRSSRKDRVKPEARRKLNIQMSDFALNLSPNDMGVFLSIMSALNESMKEDVSVIKKREECDANCKKAKKELEERRYLDRLKEEFKRRDVDGGGSLDVSEIESLLKSVVNYQNLTKDEFEATVREFISIVDSDGSGDISFEEFENALSRKKKNYARLHRGVVSLTGQEYVDPRMQRNQVPYLSGEKSNTLANAKALSDFWSRYEEQVGATKTSLNGIPVDVAQKKMVRTFKNYDYAQEAWNRLVNPMIAKPGEQSVWLLSKEMDMDSRGNVIDQLLSSLNSDQQNLLAANASPPTDLRMFVQTILSTSFGGFYIRLVDEMLPMGLPALEISLEELTIYGNFCMWDGAQEGLFSSDIQAQKRANNNYGVGKLSFDVYGKYYNTKARQIEPFLEFYQGVLDVKKDPEAPWSIVYSSDMYLHMNVTSAFMEILNANVANFTKVEKSTERDRPHIKEEGGLFWMFNESGVNFKYYVVAKKQTKENMRIETITPIVTVPPGDAHPCTLLNIDEELKDYEQQSLKEKQLRQAFRNADVDGSGELDTDEVRAVLRAVYEEEDRQRRGRTSSSMKRSSSGLRHSSSVLDNEEDLNKAVEDFIAIADTDKSGLVSWEEFKVAISKSRETVDRFISVEIDGHKPIHNIPLASIGHTQVYELIPYVEDIEAEKSVPTLYKEGVALLNKIEKPSHEELQRAYAYLRRVKELDPNYEWIDNYMTECMRTYVPTLVAITLTINGALGLQVKVAGAVSIENGTAKETECLLLNEEGEIARQNPEQHDGNERYFVLAPHGSLSIPIDLVNAGSFAIRQIGETEWSNRLPLSVREQQLYKRLTRYEREEAKKSQQGSGKKSLRTTKMVEKMGNDIELPNIDEHVPSGKEIMYPSRNCIDNQPTIVKETISANDQQLGTWSLVIQPQLVLQNVLPCGVEYAIVQPSDCPRDLLDNNGEFRVTNVGSDSKTSREVKLLGQLDYFEYVSDVNSRRLFIESGKSVQVFGLNLETPALMKMRLCASDSNRSEKWSVPFLINLNEDRTTFDSDEYELRFDNGPAIVLLQQWQAHAARTLFFYTPFWIHNRSGLDLRFKLQKGFVPTVEQHRDYFNGAKEIPLLANAPTAKAMVSVRPFQETPQEYDGDKLIPLNSRKYLPNFEKLNWSEAQDMASVGTKGELRPIESGNYSFVLAFDTRAAPGQFFRSKIFVISPRFVFTNRISRPLQVTPILLDKKGRRGKSSRDKEEINATLKENESVIVYRMVGPEKHIVGLRLRDMLRANEESTPGEWSPNIPLFKIAEAIKNPNVLYNKAEDTAIWTRGNLGDGPICNVSVQEREEILFTTFSDISEAPRYRIENRSTRHSIRYVQQGVKSAEEIVLRPQESHSFVWDDPKVLPLQLKVTPTHWKIPTVIDFMKIGPVKDLTPNEVRAEVYIDNMTRVFAVGDTTIFSEVRLEGSMHDFLTNTHIDMSMQGIGVTIVDNQPREVMNITMENLHFNSAANSRKCVLTLHHFQIDDMTPNSAYPIVLAPLDSGYNSDKREGWLPDEGERPFFSLTLESSPQPGIMIVNDFNLELHSLVVKLNLEYILGLVNVLLEFIPKSDEETIHQQGIDTKNSMLERKLPFPDENQENGRLFYFKRWYMAPFDFHLVFDSVQEDKGEGISSILGPTLGSIVGGIAYVTPEFSFGEIVHINRFFYEYDLIYDVVLKIVYAVVGQWYKIVGSVELLGDPVGLATDIVDGFALAVRQLKRDVTGKSVRKGESALTLAQTVFGVPLRSVSKVSNGLGDVVKKATAFKSQEEPDEPRHIGAGIVQSGVVFTKSLAYGASGFVKEPVRGAKSGGVVGFAKGVGRGTMQLVASPVIGTLGVVEKMTQSMSNTTHLLDEKTYEGTRRPARDLTVDPLKPLPDSNVITEVELHCLSIEGLPDNVSTQVVVRVYTQTNGCPAKDVGKYKSSTIHHTGKPKFDQSWLISIMSLDTFIEVNVFQKRKPMPKKRLGYVRFSMEEIFRDFSSIPVKILSNSKTKQQLKKRKRVRGSIVAEIASANSDTLETRDDSWRQKIRRPASTSVISDEFDLDDNESDMYEHDVEMLTSRSLGAEDSFSPTPVPIPLKECVWDAKINLSIRYHSTHEPKGNGVGGTWRTSAYECLCCTDSLPYVRTAAEILEMKFWRSTIRESNKIADPVKRVKNQTARLINLQLSKLSSITRQTSLAFPALQQLQPFEREVIVLTLGRGTYERHIQQLRKVYATLHNVGKKHERECHSVRTQQEAIDCGLRCIETLRGLPTVDLDKPIFAFVGAPNVGKSSLVRALSTASPEVANYPFTTRGITMGHIYVQGIAYQIADTPGLIYRPDESRNAIEKLALAMMEKTKASIGFVFDPTGSSGTSIEDQLLLRQELHERITNIRDDHNWIDIISKIDYPAIDTSALHQQLPGGALHVSAQTNQGLAELSDCIRQVLVKSATLDGFNIE